jgi:pimeloyl-ACP methyl ester carboxylesterase
MTRRRGAFIAVSVLLFLVALGASFLRWPVTWFDVYTRVQVWPEGFRSHYTTVDGYRVHYFTAGAPDGSPVVLIHGLGGRADNWRGLAPYIARAGYRVYMPDLIGYGNSAKPKNFSYSVGDEAAIVIDFMHQLGLKRVDLGGWSMGGWVVQLIASHDPQQVRRLMIFDSAGLNDAPEWSPAIFMPSTPAQLRKLNALLRPHPPDIPGFIARAVLRRYKQNNWIIHRALATMLTGQSVTNNLLPQFKMPVFLAWGAEDKCIPPAQGEQMHRLIPQSQLYLFPGCGHLAPLDCAGQMAPKVVGFLRQSP